MTSSTSPGTGPQPCRLELLGTDFTTWWAAEPQYHRDEHHAVNERTLSHPAHPMSCPPRCVGCAVTRICPAWKPARRAGYSQPKITGSNRPASTHPSPGCHPRRVYTLTRTQARLLTMAEDLHAGTNRARAVLSTGLATCSNASAASNEHPALSQLRPDHGPGLLQPLTMRAPSRPATDRRRSPGFRRGPHRQEPSLTQPPDRGGAH